mmetsp:Transcript_3362/g.7712  ORF Transcript_3362/g.7712 Transcript_3362/m.7712 type:complete len:260 (+) Transcript_3362:439-1218(+)
MIPSPLGWAELLNPLSLPLVSCVLHSLPLICDAYSLDSERFCNSAFRDSRRANSSSADTTRSRLGTDLRASNSFILLFLFLPLLLPRLDGRWCCEDDEVRRAASLLDPLLSLELPSPLVFDLLLPAPLPLDVLATCCRCFCPGLLDVHVGGPPVSPRLVARLSPPPALLALVFRADLGVLRLVAPIPLLVLLLIESGGGSGTGGGNGARWSLPPFIADDWADTRSSIGIPAPLDAPPDLDLAVLDRLLPVPDWRRPPAS